jgi:hypothetical protein
VNPGHLDEMRRQMEAAVKMMTPEQRKELVNKLYTGVNKLSQTIVENKDVLWESRQALKG